MNNERYIARLAECYEMAADILREEENLSTRSIAKLNYILQESDVSTEREWPK